MVFDPIGGPIGVALAEELGGRAVLVTQDNIAGNELSRTGDLAPANVRLAQRRRAHRAAQRCCDGVAAGEVELRGPLHRRATARSRAPRSSTAASASRPTRCPARTCQAGDCVAPRTVHEAILEGRRVALAL